MLPTITHRLMMVAVIVIGTLAWMTVFARIQPADGSDGISLMDARTAVWAAGLLLLIAGLPAMLGGLYVSAAGNPLSGVFTTGFCLMIFAGLGGSSEGLIFRHADWASSGGGSELFILLGIELALWALAWGLMLLLIRRYRPRIRRRFVPRRFLTVYDRSDDRLTEEDTPRFVLHTLPMLAGLVCGGMGWLGCWYLIRTPSSGQVIGAILVSFTVASMTARLIIPNGNVVYLVFSPLVAGLIAYGRMAIHHGGASSTDLIQMLNVDAIHGPALALPIHWASAGMVGVATGIGMAQAIDRVRFADAQAKPDSPGITGSPGSLDSPGSLGSPGSDPQ